MLPNLHPLIIHFPIALLATYSVMEWIPLGRFIGKSHYLAIKSAFLFLGTLATVPAGLSGQLIERQFPNQHQLVSLHSKFAFLASCMYLLLSIVYILNWLSIAQKNKKQTVTQLIPVLISVPAFIMITITGALGAVIVYGANLDPFTLAIYKVFFH